MNLGKSIDRNTVEEAGVSLEIWEPCPIVVPVPEKKEGCYIPIEILGFITNNSPNNFAFINLQLLPGIIERDGQKPPRTLADKQFSTNHYDGIYIPPKMSLVRYLMLQLFWCDNWLKIKGKICNRFQLIEDYECSWHFENLTTGNYQVRLLYSNPEGEFLFNDSQTRQTYLIKNYEPTMVSSPWLNFNIVEPIEPTERKSKQIIVDGVCFQTIVEEKIFSFPRNEGDFSRKVKMGIEITNNSLFPWRFCSFDTMIPELIGEDGLILRQACGGSQGWKTPQEADFELVRPAESVNFFAKTQLKRERDGLLSLTVAGGGQACWRFENLKFGKYQIQFTYRSLTEKSGVFFEKTERLLEDMWMGRVQTPFVEFELVES